MKIENILLSYFSCLFMILTVYFQSKSSKIECDDIQPAIPKGTPKKPYINRLYHLSNSKPHMYVFAFMGNFDMVKYFIYIDYHTKARTLCQTKVDLETKIIQTYIENNRHFYAIQYYGYSYFYDPDIAMLNLIASNLPECKNL